VDRTNLPPHIQAFSRVVQALVEVETEMAAFAESQAEG